MCVRHTPEMTLPNGLETSFSISLPQRTKHKLIMIILKNYIISILELALGYTVKSSPLPLGVSLGFAIANSPRQWAIFDHISPNSTWDQRSNIAFCLWIFSLALPLGVYVPCFVLIQIQYTW